MTDQPELPEGIGPHEEKELELMLAGEKPLAMFSDVVPASFDWGEDRFEPYVAEGQFIKMEFFLDKPEHNLTFRFVYFALPGEEWRIEKLHTINASIFIGTKEPVKEDDVETGRLLGYNEQEIQIFLNWSQQLKEKQERQK